MHFTGYLCLIRIRINGMKPVWASESTVSMPVGIDRGIKPIKALPGMNALMAFPGHRPGYERLRAFPVCYKDVNVFTKSTIITQVATYLWT